MYFANQTGHGVAGAGGFAGATQQMATESAQSSSKSSSSSESASNFAATQMMAAGAAGAVHEGESSKNSSLITLNLYYFR